MTEDFLNWDPESLEQYQFSLVAGFERADWRGLSQAMRPQPQAQLELRLIVNGQRHRGGSLSR